MQEARHTSYILYASIYVKCPTWANLYRQNGLLLLGDKELDDDEVMYYRLLSGLIKMFRN